MPTWDHDPNGRAAAFDECAHCGRELEADTWQPVRTIEEESGALSFIAFCNDDCHDAYDVAAD
ncbi:hypothetical protein J2752_000308 [Halarchaeum rubridurum]|uniref:Uncharacterized protein n=1 Tax=Halarchaeum rubridurum TaxID=489911 RepID=A0A830FY55_9EURY|nr:hypothetical protein [Halarchaeum rubridurum]MBP1953427.1 hypothetical protein [Halarchaeum rubridurum]GGM65342.1 hypothetical protein GCM10009017_14310 [Halarchaeum rubridurum]